MAGDASSNDFRQVGGRGDSEGSRPGNLGRNYTIALQNEEIQESVTGTGAGKNLGRLVQTDRLRIEFVHVVGRRIGVVGANVKQ